MFRRARRVQAGAREATGGDRAGYRRLDRYPVVRFRGTRDQPESGSRRIIGSRKQTLSRLERPRGCVATDGPDSSRRGAGAPPKRAECRSG